MLGWSGRDRFEAVDRRDQLIGGGRDGGVVEHRSRARLDALAVKVPVASFPDELEAGRAPASLGRRDAAAVARAQAAADKALRDAQSADAQHRSFQHQIDQLPPGTPATDPTRTSLNKRQQDAQDSGRIRGTLSE